MVEFGEQMGVRQSDGLECSLDVMYTLKFEGDMLYYQRTRAPQINLSPIIKDTFTATALQFSFLRDRQQRISGRRLLSRNRT